MKVHLETTQRFPSDTTDMFQVKFTRIVHIIGLEHADEGWSVSKELFPQGSKGWLLYSADSEGCRKERSVLRACHEAWEQLHPPNPPAYPCIAQPLSQLLCTATAASNCSWRSTAQQAQPCINLWSEAEGNLSKCQNLNLTLKSATGKSAVCKFLIL